MIQFSGATRRWILRHAEQPNCRSSKWQHHQARRVRSRSGIAPPNDQSRDLEALSTVAFTPSAAAVCLARSAGLVHAVSTRRTRLASAAALAWPCGLSGSSKGKAVSRTERVDCMANHGQYRAHCRCSFDSMARCSYVCMVMDMEAGAKPARSRHCNRLPHCRNQTHLWHGAIQRDANSQECRVCQTRVCSR